MLPVVAFAFAGLWTGLAGVINSALDARCGIETLSIDSLPAGYFAMIIGAVILAGLGIVRVAPSLRDSLLLGVLGCVCGVVLGVVTISSVDYRFERVYALGEELTSAGERYIVQAIEDSVTSPFGVRQVARVISGPGASLLVSLNYAPDVVPLELGQRATISKRLLPLAKKESSRHLIAKGVTAQVSVGSLEDYHFAGPLSWLYRYRANLSCDIERAGEHGSITRGVLLGDRRDISRQTRDEFGRAGIGHVLAVSGMHFAVVAGCVLRALSALHLPRAYAQMIALVICLGYVLITGGAPSALRAAGMFALLSIGLLLKRRTSVLSSLALTGIVCLALNPFWSISTGFLLSVCAVAGIGMFARLGAYYIEAAFPRLPRRVASDVALACIALLATVPIICARFGYIPILSPATNVVIVPLILATLAVSLIAAIAGSVSPTLALSLFRVCGRINQATELLTSSAAEIPGATIDAQGSWILALSVLVLAGVAWWVWPQVRRTTIKRVGTLICALVLCSTTLVVVVPMIPAQAHNRLIVLDVGQGDALLVQSGTETLLIDAGPDPALLRQELRRHQAKKIDALIFTHDHDDHLTGAQGLTASYQIAYVFCADGAQSSRKVQQVAGDLGAQLRPLKVGERVVVGDIAIDVWGPLYAVLDPSANESCLILYITSDGVDERSWLQRIAAKIRRPATLRATSLLTSGDGEASSVKRAIREAATGEVSIDVLKLGHHGSKGSVDEELLEMAQPEYVVVSVGKSNRYGHPAPSILELCRKYVRTILRTDEHGSISIELLPATVAQ